MTIDLFLLVFLLGFEAGRLVSVRELTWLLQKALQEGDPENTD